MIHEYQGFFCKASFSEKQVSSLNIQQFCVKKVYKNESQIKSSSAKRFW